MSRITGFVLLALSIGAAYFTFQIYNGRVIFPQQCFNAGFICALANLLFEQGGRTALIIVSLLITTILFLSFNALTHDDSTIYSSSSSDAQQSFEPLIDEPLSVDDEVEPQTIFDIVAGEEPTAEFIEKVKANQPLSNEELSVLKNAYISDEELEQQALGNTSSLSRD